jgi:hypothetical protein
MFSSASGNLLLLKPFKAEHGGHGVAWNEEIDISECWFLK